MKLPKILNCGAVCVEYRGHIKQQTAKQRNRQDDSQCSYASIPE